MSSKLCFVFALLAAAIAVAADPSWMGKRAAEWTDKEAYQILYDSPWASQAAPSDPARADRLSNAATAATSAAQGGGPEGATRPAQGCCSIRLDRRAHRCDPARSPESPHLAKLVDSMGDGASLTLRRFKMPLDPVIAGRGWRGLCDLDLRRIPQTGQYRQRPDERLSPKRI